jgi:nicotine blue oxidoreductase
VEIAGLVLAAGGGSRYGMPKALIPYPDKLLVQHAIDTLRDAGLRRCMVVLGAEADKVRAAATDTSDISDVVVNPEWETGLGSSLRVGLQALSGTDADAALVVLVDMPGVTAEAVRRIAEHAGRDALVMGGYGERRGHPVLLGRDHWLGVAETATGDRGARDYLRTHDVRVVPVGDVADDRDIDVPASNPYA